MSINTKHKKRGSTLLLLTALVLLIGAAVALFMWPDATLVDDTKKVEVVDDNQANEPNEVVEVNEANVPAEKKDDMPDDIEETTLINEGDVAPDFTVAKLGGGEATLSSLRGKVVLINFWATWCPPCRQELAHLQEGVLDVFKGKDVVVLPVSRGEKEEVVQEYITKMGYTFPIYLDGDQSAYKKYASNYIPRSVVVGRDGKVVYVAVGYDETVAKEVNEAIAAALK
jgi:peroxiredoxin